MIEKILLVGAKHYASTLATLFGDAAQVDDVRAADAVVRVRDHGTDLLIVALDQPGLENLRQLARLRAAAHSNDTPVLALVPRNMPDALIKAFDLGVSDCAGLPIDGGEVRARAAALLRRKRMLDRISTEARATQLLANTDAVTGLFNRRYLDTHLGEIVTRSRAGGLPLVVLMLDIDAFKPVNDRFGHAAGDRALQAVAARLSSSVRGSDMVVRYGGDELVVVMPDTDLATARRIAERLRATVEATPIGGTDAHAADMRITVSIGVAALEPGDVDGPALLHRADAALFVAKRAGRNRVETAGSSAAA
jgi:two-component system cell cycle response regulator